MRQYEWVLRRNCSITPRQLCSVYAALCFTSLSIAVMFVLHGAWMVLAFAVLEMSAVGAAFVLYARHATDRETIRVQHDRLVIECVHASRTTAQNLDLYQVRVEIPHHANALIRLRCGRNTLEIGRHLQAGHRQAFARELAQSLYACRTAQPA